MRNSTILKLMLLCGSLSLSSCGARLTPVDDSYCYLYRPLITKKGDAAKLASVPLDQRQIILGNEQVYRGTCGQKT